MYVQTNHYLARHSACSIVTYCNSSLHQYLPAYGIFLSTVEYLKVIKYLSNNLTFASNCGYTCISTCPADDAQPIPEDISKENEDQIQTILDTTATNVGQSAATSQGLWITDISVPFNIYCCSTGSVAYCYLLDYTANCMQVQHSFLANTQNLSLM